MTADPVTRAARRQNLLDRLAEQLTDWGCPPDLATTRAVALLHFAEEGGWQLPVVDVPPMQGRGSTEAGRAAALAEIRRTLTRDGSRAAQISPQEDQQAPPVYREPPTPQNRHHDEMTAK